MVPQCHLEVGLVNVPGRHPNYVCDGSSTPAPQQRGGSCLHSAPLPLAPALPPMCTAHPHPTGPARRSHSPLEEDPKSLQEAEFWQNEAISLSQAAGRQLERVRMESAFSFLRSAGNAGQVTPLADAAALSVQHPLWTAFLPAPLAARIGEVCGPSSPVGCGHFKGSACCRQVWERHLAGYLGPAGLGLWTGFLPTSASDPISWSPFSVHWSEE